MAPLLPNVVSQLVKDQEGHIGRVLGEVLYILKCVPKVVNIRRTEKCYNELPISLNNQSKFMAPMTRIIQDIAEEIDCNSMTPPLYYVNNEWIGMAPLLTIKRDPEELKVETTPTLNFTSIMPLGDHGLYTQEEASQVQKILTFGTERKAVENIITRRVVGLDTQSQGLSTLNMFSAEELQNLAKSTMKQIWGWFSDLGIFMSGILGFYVIFRLIKYILGVIINGFHLYRTFGGGFRLIACIWNTLTMWLIHSYHDEQNRRHRQQPDPEAPDLELVTPLTREQPRTFMNSEPRQTLSNPNLYSGMNFSEEQNMLPRVSTASVATLHYPFPSAPHWTDSMNNTDKL